MSHVFIVTEYGCNSTPGDLWIPISKLFPNYDDAYEHYLTVCPAIVDDHNETTRYVNTSYDPNSTSNEYIVIENRQLDAKRPFGAVIARYGVCGL